VKFQQGALAIQREQWEQAWMHFSDCIRIRRIVYAYARPVGGKNDEDPTHLEISCVLHELARVAFSQGYFKQAMNTLKSERVILERLDETADHRAERIHQARLTNLTWLRKCAKEINEEDLATNYSSERSSLKKSFVRRKNDDEGQKDNQQSGSLIESSLRCRLAARRFALERDKSGSKREDLIYCLQELSHEINASSSSTAMRSEVLKFRDEIVKWKDEPMTKRRQPILKACDLLRDVLRGNGLQVNDTIFSRRSK